MGDNEGISLGNVAGEVALLREMVLLLMAQVPESPSRSAAINAAYKRARERFPDKSPQRISVDHAWSNLRVFQSAYRPVD